MTTKQLVKMETRGTWEGNLKTSIYAREFSPFIIDEPEYLGSTNEGPNPLEYLLGGLTGCTSVMIGLIAKEKDFSFQGIEFSNTGTIDARGMKGVEGVSSHFQTVSFEAVFSTDESDDRLEELKKEVERRCPIYNLIVDAGVAIDSKWYKK
ncbi:OsmC family protein [Planococcus sp. ISL-109]|uniref:OsmC family protein n=1 Tax=Planococcus sp. ISL-109 TaxID=2819166 RepID=UPI001BECC497|nr:OsmC family protein [Planococcus sp. ISL-109]MBT2582972.1 OsmC family protein [Planococcus sp. ISL-109]